MTTDDTLHRVTSFVADQGLNVHQVALMAGVHWTAAARVLTGGDPLVSTLKAVEAIVPSDYVAPPRPGAIRSVGCDSANDEANSEKIP